MVSSRAISFLAEHIYLRMGQLEMVAREKRNGVRRCLLPTNRPRSMHVLQHYEQRQQHRVLIQNGVVSLSFRRQGFLLWVPFEK